MYGQILTNETCDKLESLLNLLSSYSGKIESSAESFEYVLNESTIKTWVENTNNGRELRQKVMNNNESLKELASVINEIYQITSQLLITSRNANNSLGV